MSANLQSCCQDHSSIKTHFLINILAKLFSYPEILFLNTLCTNAINILLLKGSCSNQSNRRRSVCLMMLLDGDNLNVIKSR